ncbi:MAG: hypothetical protein HWN65_13820 [Candidatus Helarchaeota archaeon]|nr:hypothetical protein [Candidatus Helarchaeota archaeon]
MKLIHQQSALLLILLIGFAFIAIGLTIGTAYVINEAYLDPCLSGLPITPPP